ncbi:S41 family peptidase [Candidatus Saccharibacteria bacterium]|nr:S41 family peptidase [Candidatus Saccharibacteria bacterium]
MQNQNIEKVQKNKKWLKASLIFLAIFVIFGFGYGLGAGNITLGSSPSTQNRQLSTNLSYASVEKVYDILRKNFDGKLDSTKLTDGMKKGMVNATGDPHTEYMTAEETKEFNQDLNGSFSGIGAELGKDKDTVIVVSPIAGFPAEKAGLKAKDAIIEVDGQSTYGQSLSEVVKRIRGPEGTDVKLRIVRNQQEDLTLTIKRANITIPSVESKMLENNIGYIKITRFSEDTVQLAKESAQSLKQQGAKGIILDLRGNPGGLLDAAVGVSSIWLPDGKTVLQEKRDGAIIKTYDAEGSPILEGVPTVVLIDGGSASASEIVSGALRDNKVAKLVGVKSYGKGSVQSVENLPDGSSLKVTIAHWFTPSGQSIDKQGLEPDVKVEASKDTKEDVQLQKAQEQLKQ